MADYFYNPIRRDARIVKGDTLSFGFQLQGLGGKTPDGVYFTCKETPESETPLFSQSLDDTIDERDYNEATDTLTYSVRIPPYATSGLELGRYFYDLRVYIDGDVITLMNGRLSIEHEITIEEG